MMKEAKHHRNTKGDLFLTESGFIFNLTFELFPNGNNCITYRQGNRSATSKQGTTDIIHFGCQFVPSN